jgi:predicted SAM-dependent methyltransferase
VKLNLACGRQKLDGFVNVDISKNVEPDFAVNLLEFPWYIGNPRDPVAIGPLPDEAVEEIFCSHFVEHIGDEIIDFMDEAYRVLKPGGLFRIRCPYYTSIRAVQDPTHKRFISEAMFQYFNAEARKKMGVDHYPIKSDFDVEEMRFHFPVEMQELSDDERKWLLTHSWNTAADIEVLLKKHDPDQQSVDRQENKVLLH